MRDDDETDDEGLELIEEGNPDTGAKIVTVPARKPLIPAEKDLLDLAILAAADGFFDKAERQAVAARIVEASREKLSYRHDSMIRTVILLATAWRNGQEGAKELVGVRLAVAGHFRARIERRRAATKVEIKPGQYFCERCSLVVWGGDHVCRGSANE